MKNFYLCQIKTDIGFGEHRFLEGVSIQSFAKAHNRSIVLIEPEMGRENLCLSYALVLGILHANDDKNMFNKLSYKPNIELFTKYALKLCEKAQVDLSYGGGVDELQKFQEYFKKKSIL